MKRTILLLALLLPATLGFGQEEDFHFKWDNGFKLESADEQFKLKFGGRIMWDNAAFFQDAVLDAQFEEQPRGMEFRRVRFYHSGTVYGSVGYKLQLDFAGGEVSFKDVYIAFQNIPALGEIRVGHFKEPFHLDALTSSKYSTFMERALPNAFVTERNTGVMVFDDCFDNRLGWQIGLFADANSAGDDTGIRSSAFTARLTGLPVLNGDGTRLWHLGASVSLRKPHNSVYDVEARPEAHLGPKYVRTYPVQDVSGIRMFNFETALVLGPLTVQGEYTGSHLEMKPMAGDDHFFSGYYAEASVFLTGEHRKFKSSYVGFDRVKPKKNLGQDGVGAWQLALRYSTINLNSGDPNIGGVEGGQLTDLSAGMNWYLNPVTRLMFNYVLAQVHDIGNASIAQVRVQLDF